MQVKDELGRVKEEIARNASAVGPTPLAVVDETNLGTGISDERSSVEPLRRHPRESTGTNAPETAFTWPDLNGETHTSVGKNVIRRCNPFCPVPSFPLSQMPK